MIELAQYIDGSWLAATEESVTVMAPATGEPFARVPLASPDDVDQAVAAARRAGRAWASSSAGERAEIIGKMGTLLAEAYGKEGEETHLKLLITQEVGKRLPEADVEVIETSDMISYFAARGPELLRPRAPQLNSELWPTKTSRIVFEPLGVVAVVKPWNYPLELPFWTIAPALVAGNTVVFKPSEHSSCVGVEIARLAEAAGLPPGVLNVVTGDGGVGKSLVSHDGVDFVSFTGSQKVGREVAVICAQRLRRYSLELSGNDAAIVLPDVDLELAANGMVWGALCNSGQVCVGVKRAYVHREIVSELTDRIVRQVEKLQIDKDYGPLISQAQLEGVSSQVGGSLSLGARALTGGRPVADRPGYYFEPTVLADVSEAMPVIEKECFGPVLPIIPFDDIDEAIRRANASDYGLGASVWSRDRGHAQEIAHQLEVGMVWINDVNVAFAEAPWGGVKGSGPGVELSEWGLYEFTNKKHISVEESSDARRAWWYPYS